MNILVPVDGSDYTKRMLAYIAARDELLGAAHDYTFVTVVLPIPSYPSRLVDHGVIDTYYAQKAEQVLKSVRLFADQQHWRYHAVHVAGQAAEEIARLADKERSDLIVMGSHGHTALGNVILGSVANAVLARSKVPVLLVR